MAQKMTIQSDHWFQFINQNLSESNFYIVAGHLK